MLLVGSPPCQYFSRCREILKIVEAFTLFLTHLAVLAVCYAPNNYGSEFWIPLAFIFVYRHGFIFWKERSLSAGRFVYG
jgi:hypothetical protein